MFVCVRVCVGGGCVSVCVSYVRVRVCVCVTLLLKKASAMHLISYIQFILSL